MQERLYVVVGIRAQGRLSANGLDIGEGWGSETMKSDDFDYYVYEFIQRGVINFFVNTDNSFVINR